MKRRPLSIFVICLALSAGGVRAAMIKAVSSCTPKDFAECKSSLGVTHTILMDCGSGFQENTNAAAMAIAAGLEPVLVVQTADKKFPDLRDGGNNWESRCYEVMTGNPSRYIIVGNEANPWDVLTANGFTPYGGFSRADFEQAAKLVVLEHRIANFVAKRLGGKIVGGGAFNIDKTSGRGESTIAFIYTCLEAGLANQIDKLCIHYGPKGDKAEDPVFTALVSSIRAKMNGLAVWNTETNYGDRLHLPRNDPAVALRNVWNCNKSAGIELMAWYYYTNGKDKRNPENLGGPSIPGFDAPNLRATFRGLR